MRSIIAVISLTTFISAVSKLNNLNFRNLYKGPISPITYESDSKIIGGQEAVPHSIPYQAFLEIYSNKEGWFCAGSLISERYVLTAGHCCDDGIQVYVTLGAHNPFTLEDTQIQAVTRNIYVHENYNPVDIINDIALIQLPAKVHLTDAIQPVSLPSSTDSLNDFAGDNGRVSGWGLTDGHGSSMSQVLRYADVEVISNGQCKSSFGNLSNSVLCTSGDKNSGTCSGDSGGPLTISNVQIGVVSFGLINCPHGYPSAFTRITSFLDWLAIHSDVQIK